MDRNFWTPLCLFYVCQSLMAFNVDPEPWKYFTNNGNSGFGYKVIQKQTSLLVSDPLIQHSQTQRGQIYQCFVKGGYCIPLPINVPNEAVNMSLGLSMSLDPRSSRAVVCGPTIPKNCDVTTYNGMCFKISQDNTVSKSVPRTLRECPMSQLDIAFLLDGSGSVSDEDFNKMKGFVIKMIQSFIDRDTQFAIAQFSTNCYIHYMFQQVKDPVAWENAVKKIPQRKGWTYTAGAIKRVVEDLFVSKGGARPSARKILLVITDGESTDSEQLNEAVAQAQNKNITRYAIGVGDAFKIDAAKRELALIASLPTDNHVFKVNNFNALESIREKLKENIIAIEGTQTSGDSSRMEFAQDGFSAAFTSNTDLILTAVGAFQWKGGYTLYKPSQSDVFQAGSEHESYLGYSLAIATIYRIKYAVMGAPRHKHKGQVTVSRTDRTDVKQLDPPEPQIGSYFGAEVCVVDLNSDSNTDLLLVSAPMYIESDREGKVFVYTFTGSIFFSGTVLMGLSGQRGRFGSSLASPADLNGDGFRDVLVGAPLEEDGQGSIYIFNGREDRINPTYSQRVAGSSVRPGLRYFGISLSQSSLDQTQDDLPDIAVGSMGAVLLLRSRPIMLLETRVTYSPSKIPTSETEQSLKSTMRVCFTMHPYGHQITGLNAKINFTVMLDTKHQKYRAYFSPGNRLLSGGMTIQNRGIESCNVLYFHINAVSEDALNPLSNQLTFTFEGLPSGRMQNLRPILLPETKTTSDHNLDFLRNCGHDDICVDDLRMDFNFSGSTIIEVGIMQELNVTVSVENRGENSYNTLFTLKYPTGLSYRRITSKQGRVECVSVDGEQSDSPEETRCYISKPILKSNTQAVFQITYSIDKESTFNQMVKFTAKIDSGNSIHSQASHLFEEKSIGVKYGIYVALIRHEDSSLHINFTAQKNNLDKPVKQILEVENDFRELPSITVLIRVPVMLGSKSIWTNKNLQIPDCVKDEHDEQPHVTDIMEVIKKDRVVNCSVAVCAVFSCDISLMKKEWKLFNLTDNVTSGWIEQTGLRSAVFELVSSASLDYDKSKYVFFSSDSQYTAPSVQIITQVEVYEEVNLTKEIIGGVIGGLLLLALITAALYKAGFFKNQYKQLLENAEQSAEQEPSM